MKLSFFLLKLKLDQCYEVWGSIDFKVKGDHMLNRSLQSTVAASDIQLLTDETF